MCMEILLHERIISLVAEKRKGRGERKRGRAIMCSSLFFFKLFTLDSSWMQTIDYDCKGARERIQPGICFSGGLHAGTWCHHQIRGRNGADASVRAGGGDASEHLRLKQKKKDADARIESTRRISPVLLVADLVVGDHLAIYEACADNRFLHFLIMCILHPVLWLSLTSHEKDTQIGKEAI